MIAQGLEQILTQIAVSQPAHVQTHVSQVPSKVQATQKQNKALHAQHENNKTTLIFGAFVLVTALTLFKFKKSILLLPHTTDQKQQQ